MSVCGLEMTAAWGWIVAGLALVVAELAMPGFVIFFFGLGAILTGLLLFTFPQLPLSLQLLIFAASSVLFLLAFRRFMPHSFRGRETPADADPDDDELAGAKAKVSPDGFAPDGTGKVEFRGTLWNARAEGGEPLPANTPVAVVGRENLTLVVKPRS